MTSKMKCDYCGKEGEWKWDRPARPGKRVFCNIKCWEEYHIEQGDWSPDTIALMKRNRGE